jgi:predicted nucleic acid-binding protein
MIVLDASAFLDVFIAPLETRAALRVRIVDQPMHAPVTFDAEVLHGLRRQWIRAHITADAANFVLESLRTVSVTRHPLQPLVARMWHLRQNVTAYDAAYVALAESLDAPLITRDGRLARSAGHTARIEYIE